MSHRLLIGVLSAMAATVSTATFAQGTAAEAKAMLELYVFCSNVSDGRLLADGNPNAKQLIGTDDRTLKDSTGKPFGQELFTAGQKPEGQVSEVSYLFPKPGPDKTPVQKVSFVTRVGDIYCGVGYYK